MNQNLELIRQKCIEANPEIVELKFGCFLNPTDDGIHFALQDSIGGVKAIEIVNDEGDMVFTSAILIAPKTIIGRPIRLADVLLAIGANVWKPYQGKAISVLELMIQHWNLRKDDLNQQSEDTINFLAGLLG